MKKSDWQAILEAATQPALKYLESLPERSVYSPVDPEEIRAVVGGPLPEGPTTPHDVIADLARDLEPFVAAHASGRYFGFVIGGLHPAAYGAELLASTWDQNAGLYAVTPGVAVVEHVAQEWLLDLLDLPREASVGFVTGGQMANFTCLAAARDSVLRKVGWDVEADGLQGAPRINVVVKSEKHSTVARALRYLGLGYSNAIEVPSDDQSRMDSSALATTLSRLDGPTILCVEAGNVNTGSFDDFVDIADVVQEHRAESMPIWVHCDGAVGLWVRAAGARRGLGVGLERLDSWSTDAHKLLNVAYDSGIAICRDASAHRASMGVQASYLIHSESESARDPMDWNPEFSRRARGLGVYATLRALGRSGVGELVDRACDLAVRFADSLRSSGKAEVVNDVVFNQVLVRWLHRNGDHDGFNDRVIQRTQEDGTAFFSGTTWNGMRLMRLSVSDWATDEDDIERSLEALLRAASAG
ncbi:MAG: aspartate aminotransferase family protein [Actinobacteria bacterium]|nr:aspartate aminotransferase family protein [Actinomycetota bacterium]